jgi:hypothetical protein
VVVIGSLIRQLLSLLHPFPPAVQDIFSRYRAGLPLPPVTVLKPILIDLCKESPPAYIIIDALDECESKQRKFILETLEALAKTPARVFVTSRPHPDDIQKAFSGWHQITIEAKEIDVRTYIKVALAEDSPIQEILDEALKEDIANAIVGRCQGMYVSFSDEFKISF